MKIKGSSAKNPNPLLNIVLNKVENSKTVRKNQYTSSKFIDCKTDETP